MATSGYELPEEHVAKVKTANATATTMPCPSCELTPGQRPDQIVADVGSAGSPIQRPVDKLDRTSRDPARHHLMSLGLGWIAAGAGRRRQRSVGSLTGP